MFDLTRYSDPMLRMAGWSTPIIPKFDDTWAGTMLGHNRHACRRQRQGLCPDPSLCADCAWTEVGQE